MILLAIGFASTAFGKRFRLYSIATILVLVVTGGFTATQASRLEANLPTRWAGLTERITIGGYLVWQVVLAIATRHDILVAYYHIVRDQVPLRELGPDWQRKRSSVEHRARRLRRQLEALGYTASLERAEQPA